MTSSTARILVVDDNEDSRQLMAMLLGAEGYDVDQAGSAQDGLRCLQSRRYALVLTDYHMPDHTGMWMLQQAQERQLLDGAATMVVTADYDAAELIDDPLVIRKPVDFKRFLPQLRMMLSPKDDARPQRPADEKGGPGERAPAVETRIELVLYVTAESIPCHRAKAAMKDILKDYDANYIDFRIYDLDRHLGAAQRDRIIFTPTLVKRWPDPKVWVLGDLTRRAVVVDLLEMAGVAPKPSA
jgi:CheY-like chemotaxis protein